MRTWTLLATCGFALLASEASTFAAEPHLRFEPAVGHPVGAPQTDYFGPGGGGAIKAGLSLVPVLDLQAQGGYYAFSTKKPIDHVSLGSIGLGPRFQWPRDRGVVSPWLDAAGLYVRTGVLDRLGLEVGGGAQFRLGDTGTSVGPFVRYMHVFQADRLGIDGGDARIALVGVSLEIGLGKSGPAAPPPPEASPPVENGRVAATLAVQVVDADGDGIADATDKCPTDPGPRINEGCPILDADGDGTVDALDMCPAVPGPRASRGCPDGDGDGVADDKDACPAVRGESDNRGCPRYRQVTVKFDDRLELSQKVFFAYNRAEILPKSYDLLEEVAQALKDAPHLLVRVEGHTDVTGSEQRNAELSQARALAVRDFLIDHGVELTRLDARGYGSMQPLDTNATVDGREKNRRVEFVILKSRR